MTRPHYITPPLEESMPLFAAARRSDPATSHAAARTSLVSEHQRLIMDALAVGPAGASGIAERCGLSGHQVKIAQRFTEGRISQQTAEELAAAITDKRNGLNLTTAITA